MYGFKEDSYLDKNNYNTNHKYLEKTFKIFKSQIEEKKDDNLAVSYYKDTYNFIPTLGYDKGIIIWINQRTL